MVNKPIAFVGILALFLVLLEVFSLREEKEGINFPIIRVLALFCLYSAMHAPEIYAGVEVSRGVYNMNYWTFLLMIGGILLILADRMTCRWNITAEAVHKWILIPGMFLCLILVIVFRSNIKDSTTYICLQYISSGEASDYKEQMELQTKLLTDETVQDVVVPFINDIQGPLMHMPVTENPEAWTSEIAEKFYEKQSVVAIPRPEWNELYGDS